MAGPIVTDLVMETTTTTGTGTLTLGGAVTGFATFAGVGTGNTCLAEVFEVDSNGNRSGAWEIFFGTYTSAGTTLTRATVFSSSTGSAVNFAAGAKRVILLAMDAAHAGILLKHFTDGRLTLTTVLPVTTADVTAALSLFYTPYLGNVVWVPDAAYGKNVSFAELSIKATDSAQTATFAGSVFVLTALTDTSQLVRGMQVTGASIGASSTIASIDSATQVTLDTLTTGSKTNSAVTFKLPPDKNYDVFAIASGTTAKLQFSNAWSSDTARADALNQTTYPGTYTNNAAINGTDSNTIAANRGVYLGTVRTTATAGQLEDSTSKRYVWNQYNRQPRKMVAFDTTDSWTYSTTTWREANGGSTLGTSRVGVVTGNADAWAEATAIGGTSHSSVSARSVTGIGVDDSSVNLATLTGGNSFTGTTLFNQAKYLGYPGLGFHTIRWLEIAEAVATITWRGDAGQTYVQCGMVATIWG